MDSQSQQSFYGPQATDQIRVNSNSFNHSEHLEAQCIVCRRDYTPEATGSEAPGSISICRECKSLVVDDNEATPPIRNFRRRRQRRQRATRYGSSESIEDLFSQQFSQLISLVRQNHEIQGEEGEDADATVTVLPLTSYSPARNWPRSRRGPVSDDTESLDHGDSLFGESDSNISFYGGNSEASFDGQSLLGREIFIQQDYESHFYTDTDIDPMHAGLDQWISDDEDEDIEWEQVNTEEASVRLVDQHGHNHDMFHSPNDSSRSDQNGMWTRWRVRQADLAADFEEPDVLPLFGNAGDYLDARGFEELLEHLANNDDLRRGAPPASASAIGSLPNVIISKEHEKDGSLVCAVCKDLLPIGAEAKQLPCLHLYHLMCILPWLRARNSCPVCRFELPTDDPDYEEGKRGIGGTETHEFHQQNPADISNVSSDMEVDDRRDEVIEALLEEANVEAGDSVANSVSRASSNARRWYFIAAAPVVSIVGIALALWFRNSFGDRTRIRCRTGGIGEWDSQQSHRSHSTSAIVGRSRRWWLF